jgi:uncharacterized repeat protein (TIGR03803 family)
MCRPAAAIALALVVVLGLGAVTTRSAQAQTYTESVLHSFTGPPDGGLPQAALIMDAQGNLYGTTAAGGAGGYGTVFMLNSQGQEKVLHSFTFADGAGPVARLVMDGKGNLYGTTAFGGVTRRLVPSGVVFKVSSKGTETVLYNFCPTNYHCTDGAHPRSGLIMDAQGNLYGTTLDGGDSNCSPPNWITIGCGTVFNVDPTTRKETVLYTFNMGARDGATPYADLIWDATKKNLIGTTVFGGENSSCVCGTVFKLDPTTKQETLLYKFKDGADGANPFADLIMDAQGNLYGTTVSGGAGYGVVFEVSQGQQTVLYTFKGGTDGAWPEAGLIMDKQGNLYGTTYGGGASGYGTVFKLPPLLSISGTVPGEHEIHSHKLRRS